MHAISRVSAALQRTTRQGNTLQHRNAQRRTAMQCNTIASRTHPYLKIHAMRRISAAVMHCNALQHTATLCNRLQQTSTHWNTLEHTAIHCSTLQHTAIHHTTLQHNSNTHTPMSKDPRYLSNQCCNVMYYYALQHTATHFNAPQHAAMQSNTLATQAHPYLKIHAISRVSAAL